MKIRMKNLVAILLLLVLVTSCQTRVVGANRPLKNNSLELYQTYTVQTVDAKTYKMKVLKLDDQYVYGKLKSGEAITLPKTDVREVRKPDPLSSVLIGLAAVAAVVFIPM